MYYPRGNLIDGPSRILRHRLGTDKEYSVWDAEAVGGLMALWLLRGSNRISRLPISIYSDSQAFIKSVGNQRAKLGYHLMEHFTQQGESLLAHADPTRRPERIMLQWIAAHENVKGNKRADEEAKRAAAGLSSPAEHLPHYLRSPLPLSAGIMKMQYMYQLKNDWKDKWALSPRKAHFDKVDPDFPFNKFRKIQEDLSHSQSSLIIQLQTNHFSINAYLHKIGKSNTKRCESCYRVRSDKITETITHFLFECQSYNYERHNLDRILGARSRNLKAILAKKNHIKTLLCYIGKTGGVKRP